MSNQDDKAWSKYEKFEYLLEINQNKCDIYWQFGDEFELSLSLLNILHNSVFIQNVHIIVKLVPN